MCVVLLLICSTHYIFVASGQTFRPPCGMRISLEGKLYNPGKKTKRVKFVNTWLIF